MGGLLISGYRVLDLAEEGCLLGGKILADLGADVIKIEPPGGSPIRNIGPFYKDSPDTEKSLFWFAYNANKRDITLDIATTDGQALSTRLVKTSDIVLESFAPGYLDSLGLGYQHLSQIRPELVLTSVTPFGQAGPYAHYKMTDIVGQAMWGMMRIKSYLDSHPYRMTTPQVEFRGGLHDAVGYMVALHDRELTARGNNVDVGCQVATVVLDASVVIVPARILSRYEVGLRRG